MEKSAHGSILARATAKLVLGTTLQWFNFFIAAVAAALVWPTVFFKGTAEGVPLSIVAYAAAFVTRPLGAVSVGYISDNFGRKTSLVVALLLMSAGTMAIALTPSYASVGVLASVLLILFRAVQGFGIGGHWGGVASYISELASTSRWKNFWTSWIQASLSFGAALATFSLAFADYILPHAEFLNTGWRLIFVFGAFAVMAGGIISYRMEESRDFTELKQKRANQNIPLLELFRNEGRKIFELALVEVYEVGTSSILILPLSIIYLESFRISQFFATTTVTLATFTTGILVVTVGAVMSVVGKKKYALLVSTALGAIITSYPYLELLRTGDLLYAYLGQIALLASLETGYAVLAAVSAERFTARNRASAIGVSYQLSAAIAGIINITVVSWLISFYNGVNNAIGQVALVATALCVISFVTAMLTLK